MKKLFLTTILAVLSACVVEQRPAPVEQKGARFYNKENAEDYSDNSSSSDTDVDHSSYRSGESVTSRPLENPETLSSDFVPPSKTHRTGKSVATTTQPIDSSKVYLREQIDGDENESPSRYEARYKEPEPEQKPKRTSSTDDKEYLDLTTLQQQKTHQSLAVQKEEKPTPAKTEAPAKEFSVRPKEKPVMEEPKEQEVASIEEKPTKAEPAEEPEAQEKKPLRVSPKSKPESLNDKPEPEKPAKKPEPKQTAEKEEKPEAKEARVEKEVKEVKEAKKETHKEEKMDNLKPASTNKKDVDTKLAEELAPKIKAPIAEAKPKTAEADHIEMPQKPNAKKEEVASTTPDISSVPKLEKPANPNGPLKFAKPLQGKVTQNFKPGSDGIIIEAPEGTPVKASAEGTVVYSGAQLQGYGNMIVIKHRDGYLTAYSHLQDLELKKGAKISTGDVIGKVGKSGNAATPQLHFGIRKGRTAVNPQDYL